MADAQHERDTDPDRARRRVEVKRGDGWEPTTMRELVVGDRFRMFEGDGSSEPVEDGAEWTVAAPPKPRDGVPGRWQVECYSDSEIAARAAAGKA